jgi:hypothetical protein
MLLLISSVRSEEVYLNCKFQNGILHIAPYRPHTLTKGDLGTDDINIILDTRKKKIIKAPHYIPLFDNSTQVVKGGKETYYSSWSDNEVKWDSRTIRNVPKVETHAFMVLNRRSGTLTTRFIHDDGEFSETKKSFFCTKESKKF